MAAVTASANVRFPVVTVLVALAAGAVFGFPDVGALFLYDRSRILEGETWRILTGHLVHFSPQHLGYNLVLFALTGALLEFRSRARYVWLLALTVFASNLYFLLRLPEMIQYGGLSGLASANVVYLSLLEIRRDRKTRLFWTAILFLFVAKVGYEILTRKALFVAGDDMLFEVVPAAHVIGAISAVILFYVFRMQPNKQ